MPGQGFFVFETKTGFLVENGARTDPLDHKLVTSAPVKQGPYGSMRGENRIPLSPAAPEGSERDPISEEEIDTARVGSRGRARGDKWFVACGGRKERKIIEGARMGNG